MKSTRWLVSYVVVALVGLSMAFLLSLKFTSSAHSQTGKLEAPSAGDLPAEFLNETTSSPSSGNHPANTESARPTATSSTPAGSGQQRAAERPAAVPSRATPPSAPPQQATTPHNPSVEVPVETPPMATSGGVVSDGATAPATVPPVGSSGDYFYDPTGRRDPFMPYRGFLPLDKGRSRDAKQVQLDPLLRWDVDRLQVIGILWEVNSPRAMIKDPDGAIYTVMKNTKVGRNSGYVAAIREGEVVVVQSVEFEGNVTKETKILELGK